MWAEHLQSWLEEAQDEENLNSDHWLKVVDIVQAALLYVRLTEEEKWHAIVMLPKCGGDLHGIGLAEVIWKMVVIILDHRLSTVIEFHDVLHCFGANRGTGTTSLEAKLLQHLVEMREDFL